MQDIFGAITGAQILWIAFVACLSASASARLFVIARRRSQQREIDAALKMEMLRRVLPAEES